MQTILIEVQNEYDEAGIARAGAILRAGGLVAIPTETVYGLAANALDPAAVNKIFAAKGRPGDNPLIVHVAAFDEIRPLVTRIGEKAEKLASLFWPGPLTIILPKSAAIPDEVSAGLGTVALRMPSHPVAAALIKAAGVPLAAPSANISGRPSPTNAQHVLADMDGKIDAVVDAGPCSIGVESTVISLAGSVPCLLRPGAVTVRQLEQAVGAIDISPAVFADAGSTQQVMSPGMKYRHYSPKARVIILRGGLERFIDYVVAHRREGDAVLCFEGEKERMPLPAVTFGHEDKASEQAKRLFQALREADELPAQRVFARCPGREGLGLAVYNRLLRAAGFEVVEL